MYHYLSAPTVIALISLLILVSCSSFVGENSTKDYASKFQATFKEHLPKFKECYQLQTLKENKKESVVVFDFTIDSDGKAKESEVRGGGFAVEKVVEACMMTELEKIQFEKPLPEGGSRKVKQPVVFQN